MEQFDIESHRTINNKRDCRFISLRKYTQAICLIEAIAICVLVYLLFFSDTIGQKQTNEINQKLQDISDSNNVSQLLKTDLYKACNLRKHDAQHAIQCSSSEWFACAPVEESQTSGQINQDALLFVDGQQGTAEQVATVISTSKGGRRLSKQHVVLKRFDCKPQLDAHNDPCRFSTRLVVQPQQRLQKIIGWGGALTDSSIQNILALTTNGTRRLLDDYFGPDGLRYNMIRITIGGSDFSARFYTNDDSLKDDIQLDKFSLREEDLLYKIPILKMIKNLYAGHWLDKDSLKVFASMWSPPVWMKTNNHYNKGQLKGSISDHHWSTPPDEELYFDALAELKIKFIIAYQNEIKFNLWGLTVMNEPQFSVQPFLQFNTMIFPNKDYANYVAKYLGPKIKHNPELKHVKLIAHDDNRRYLINYTLPILQNPTVKQFIDGVATHSYVDEDYDKVDLIYDNFNTDSNKDFFTLPTELCSGHLPFMEKALIGNWHRGMHYALDIIRSLKHSAAGWVDWNMVLDQDGGPGWLGGRLDAPIIVDKQHDMYYKSPMFYVIGQFSRYIPPGSVKVQTKTYNDIYDNHFEVVTFSLPYGDKLATVVVNNNPYPVEFKLKLASDKNYGLRSNSYYSYTCEADSVSTIIYSSKL